MSSNQPSRLIAWVFISLSIFFFTSFTSSGVNSSSISSSISASSKTTPIFSSISSTSSLTLVSSTSIWTVTLDGAISINSSLLILSLISGEKSSGFFTFFFWKKLYQKFLPVCHQSFGGWNCSSRRVKVKRLVGRIQKWIQW